MSADRPIPVFVPIRRLRREYKPTDDRIFGHEDSWLLLEKTAGPARLLHWQSGAEADSTLRQRIRILMQETTKWLAPTLYVKSALFEEPIILSRENAVMDFEALFRQTRQSERCKTVIYVYFPSDDEINFQMVADGQQESAGMSSAAIEQTRKRNIAMLGPLAGVAQKKSRSVRAAPMSRDDSMVTLQMARIRYGKAAASVWHCIMRDRKLRATVLQVTATKLRFEASFLANHPQADPLTIELCTWDGALSVVEDGEDDNDAADDPSDQLDVLANAVFAPFTRVGDATSEETVQWYCHRKLRRQSAALQPEGI